MKNKKLHIHQVDTFTATPFKGCPASVIFGAEGLSDEKLEMVAKEVAPTNIAYLYPGKKGDFALRFFTNKGEEIKFCVSSALAALTCVAKAGAFGVKKGKSYPFKIEAGKNLYPFHVEMKGEKEAKISYEMANIELEPSHERLDQISLRLGLPSHLLHPEHLPMIEKKARHLYLPTNNLENLAEVQLDAQFALPYLRENNLATVSFVTPETFEKGHHAHTRSWTPWLSAQEQSYLGALPGGIAHFLHKSGWIQKNPQTLILEQGDFLDRPGRAKVHMQEKSAQVQTESYHLCETLLEI
ncbi:MAG: PhzF family phenazine biosynthesis isomerase [Candidatus Algichlamydia australiensis]|nr:PhzF family phenazine biosynthesis isomerase [Chlamydiales bacterium]